MNACLNEAALIQQLQSLECQLSNAISAGIDAYSAFSAHLDNVLSQGRQLVHSGQASPALTQVLSSVVKPLTTICAVFTRFEEEKLRVGARQADGLKTILTQVSRRRRKRSTRSRKSKAGKNGRVRQSGKKTKRGRKSPVGNPKRRVQAEAESSTSGLQNKRNPTTFDSSGKKCRTVTAPPTDSMKFGGSLMVTSRPLLCTLG